MAACEKISLVQIPQDLQFVGYYWLSDQKKPTVQKNMGNIDHKIFSDLPFVIEANFFAPKDEISISIRNIEGEYHVWKYDLKDASSEGKKYLGKEFDFLMVEAWEEVEDRSLEDMKTFVPAWAAFAGFC